MGAALDDVSGDDSRGKLIPGFSSPAKLIAQRSHGERGVGGAAGDDNMRSVLQRLDNRLGPDVRICREHLVANAGERLAGVHVGEGVAVAQEGVQLVQEVVASDDPDAKPCRNA